MLHGFCVGLAEIPLFTAGFFNDLYRDPITHGDRIERLIQKRGNLGVQESLDP